MVVRHCCYHHFAEKQQAQSSHVVSEQLHQGSSSDRSLFLYTKHCYSNALQLENSEACTLSDPSGREDSLWIQMKYLGRQNIHSKSDQEAGLFTALLVPKTSTTTLRRTVCPPIILPLACLPPNSHSLYPTS